MSEEIKETVQEEEQKEEKKEEKKIFEIKGKPTKKRRKGAKSLDLKDSVKLFEQEVFVHLVDPSVNLDDYVDLTNKDGVLDIGDLPDECVFEFVCRYIDPGTMQELANTPMTIEIPNSEDLSDQELGEEYRKMMISRANDGSAESDLKYAVIHACVIDPEFESPEQVKKVLPMSWVNELYFEITRGAIGENLRSRFRKASTKK